MTSGCDVFWTVTLNWAVVSDVPGGDVPVVLVRFWLPGDDLSHFGLAAAGAPPRPLCRCEHLREGEALACGRARVARAQADAAAARQRIAALPAPEGARYLRHCDTHWRADAGGACPTCGAAGDAVSPEAVLSRSPSLGATSVRTGLPVDAALRDLGLLDSPHVRRMDVGYAFVWDAAFPGGIHDVAERLTAAGWSVTGAPKAARKGRAA